MQNFLLGTYLSLIYSYLFLPVEVNELPKIKLTIYPFVWQGMVIIPFSKKQAIHIHHWVIHLLLFYIINKLSLPTILSGFTFGLFIQGLSYPDHFSFIEKNPFESNY